MRTRQAMSCWRPADSDGRATSCHQHAVAKTPLARLHSVRGRSWKFGTRRQSRAEGSRALRRPFYQLLCLQLTVARRQTLHFTSELLTLPSLSPQCCTGASSLNFTVEATWRGNGWHFVETAACKCLIGLRAPWGLKMSLGKNKSTNHGFVLLLLLGW